MFDREEKTKRDIFCLIVDDRLRNKIVNTRVYYGVNVGANQLLVVCGVKALSQRWQHHTKMVTMELEKITVSELLHQNVKDEYVERLEDSLSEIKWCECLETGELWNIGSKNVE
ncbi:hypothetical protein EVAR_61619_1 [Eumeta japonica]|uniref:Uncharacterized protein n=1 Tax=Eumeta variegata TaxID=151549 RepID=A0A4C1ZH88_EUMVA|nr:hypothetical protein EVAR_61619_1 [Eumeta japonica]